MSNSYVIVKARSPEALEKLVNAYVDSGYQPYGGICYDTSYYLQAVERYSDVVTATEDKEVTETEQEVTPGKWHCVEHLDSVCPKCGKGHLVLISNGVKSFHGCSRYPDCKFSETSIQSLTKYTEGYRTTAEAGYDGVDWDELQEDGLTPCPVDFGCDHAPSGLVDTGL